MTRAALIGVMLGLPAALTVRGIVQHYEAPPELPPGLQVREWLADNDAADLRIVGVEWDRVTLESAAGRRVAFTCEPDGAVPEWAMRHVRGCPRAPITDADVEIINNQLDAMGR